MRDPNDKRLTVNETLDRLGIGRTKLHKLTKGGFINPVTSGRSVHYWMSEVDRHGAAPLELAPVEAATAADDVEAPAADQAMPSVCAAPEPPKPGFYNRRLAELIDLHNVHPMDGENMHRITNIVHDEMARRAAWGIVD